MLLLYRCLVVTSDLDPLSCGAGSILDCFKLNYLFFPPANVEVTCQIILLSSFTHNYWNIHISFRNSEVKLGVFSIRLFIQSQTWDVSLWLGRY